MILVLSSSGDVTADYVVDALLRKNAHVVRLNTNDLLTEWRIEWATKRLAFSSASRTITPADVEGVYFRRAYSPQPPPEVAQVARRFITREARTMLNAFYSALDCLWISNPTAIALAENKPRQLALASECGFLVPETIITNDADLARAFFESQEAVVTKAISYGDLGEKLVLHTSLIEHWASDFAEDIALVPTMLQAYVKKKCEYRVTVVQSQVFACRIDSQNDPEYSVDMRRGLDDPSMTHELAELPASITSRCIDIVRKLDLQFGAIDLVEDLDGRLWFLEINPNGQWAWIEDRIGAPISDAIAEALVRG